MSSFDRGYHDAREIPAKSKVKLKTKSKPSGPPRPVSLIGAFICAYQVQYKTLLGQQRAFNKAKKLLGLENTDVFYSPYVTIKIDDELRENLLRLAQGLNQESVLNTGINHHNFEVDDVEKRVANLEYPTPTFLHDKARKHYLDYLGRTPCVSDYVSDLN